MGECSGAYVAVSRTLLSSRFVLWPPTSQIATTAPSQKACMTLHQKLTRASTVVKPTVKRFTNCNVFMMGASLPFGSGISDVVST